MRKTDVEKLVRELTEKLTAVKEESDSLMTRLVALDEDKKKLEEALPKLQELLSMTTFDAEEITKAEQNEEQSKQVDVVTVEAHVVHTEHVDQDNDGHFKYGELQVSIRKVLGHQKEHTDVNELAKLISIDTSKQVSTQVLQAALRRLQRQNVVSQMGNKWAFNRFIEDRM